MKTSLCKKPKLARATVATLALAAALVFGCNKSKPEPESFATWFINRIDCVHRDESIEFRGDEEGGVLRNNSVIGPAGQRIRVTSSKIENGLYRVDIEKLHEGRGYSTPGDTKQIRAKSCVFPSNIGNR